MLGSRLIRSALLLLCTVLLSTQGQAANDLFKARYETRKAMDINQTFSSSGSIPLDGLGTIYALSIDATITQPREASFVRVVLEDKDGHQYLVAECDRFRYDEDVVNLQQFCQETAALNGIKPISLKCYVAGDATIQIIGIHSTSTPPTRGVVTKEETEQIRKEQVQDVVDRINAYNEKHNKMWVAGVTDQALIGGDDRYCRGGAYFANMKYYVAGIYEFGEPRTTVRESPSAYVDSFSWCNRHGRDWITVPKSQELSNWCSVFAAVGAVEAMVNLYYNNDTINLNLSEQDVANSLGFTSISDGTFIDRALDKIIDYGVIDDYSFPTFGTSLPTIRPTGIEKVYISGYDTYLRDTLDSEVLKHILINKGPLASGVHNPSHYHSMLLIGYDKIKLDTLYYMGDEGWHKRLRDKLGQTFWIFKNSFYGHPYGEHDINGYMYAYFYDLQNHFMEHSFTITPDINWIGHSDYEIVCEDRDGDGYFNWGIGPRPDNRLPAWAEQEEDGDDSNRFKGPMDEYGYLEDISYPTTPYVIDHDMTDQQLIDSLGISRILRRSIKLNQGVTFTVTGDLAFCRYKGINMYKNSTLVIDGGTLVDLKLGGSGTGRSVRVINGGTIECLKGEQFLLPHGISMEMDEGGIK